MSSKKHSPNPASNTGQQAAPLQALLASHAARRRLLQPQRNQQKMAAKKPKKPPVRHHVRKGDVVKFYSPLEHQTGVMGTVIATPSKKWCIVRSIGARYEAWDGSLWVVHTQKPRGNAKDGEPKWVYSIYIKKVVFRKDEYIPPPPKVRPQPLVLRNQEELLAHITSGDDEKHVVFRPEVTPPVVSAPISPRPTEAERTQ